ncbi:hypothetical protein C1Y40_04653 [Mycobacterium talmoniae]|uniref:Methyltransferase type 11 domain-containing protein n=1 Tax=Mycobacterium talmoniae TaxID=1858794 RepID=A0A2S8BEV5_9MYCO|nr:class I SAM-dependent methyltransferase [Mycobacterium eburneum]PQM45193.1 hypothetical protein C1Y40_04653 [Mycobacterium talmoniae]TDH57691.1 class I SAM-dependent methyltransferase [Mycobacterium eburneum]
MLRAATTLLQKADRRQLADPRSLHALFHKTDRKHWGDPRSLHPSWEPRTRKAAALVPARSRVIEFGAGNRILERYLDSSCTYTPSDLVDRGPGTIVCDLNRRPLPDLGVDGYDVAVIMGVLEYLRDVPSVLDWLASHVQVCVLSYACADTNGHSPRAWLETVKRLKAGWMNHYREADLRSLFGERGFALVRQESWENQRLFVFSQSGAPA